jgi:ABC-2 type transport system permease protein
MIGIAKGATSLLAFVSKELTEILRAPAALVSLVVGPLLVILLFGVGFNGYAAPLRTVIVLPAASMISEDDVSAYTEDVQGLDILEITDDRDAAVKALEQRAVDVVLVAPGDVEERLRNGEQASVEVMINVSDPIAELNASHVANRLSDRLNRRIIEAAARSGQQAAVDAGADSSDLIPPEVVAAPTRTEFENVAPVKPSIVAFYGAAMLPFVLQHLAVSLVALSLVRERSSGSFELFRVAPVSAGEVVMGKAAAFALISALAATAIALLLIEGLGVPFLGDPLALAATLALVVAASLGLGVVIAMVARSERQVVQLALLVLLASVFFSGLVLKLELFAPGAQSLAFLLPATHGIALTQDLMLFGRASNPWHFAALAGIALVLLGVGWFLLRREMANP